MANSRIGKKGTPDPSLNYEEASVDTDPGASGYGCEGVSLLDTPWLDKMTFYISSITGATVTLQWSRDNSTWTDYDDYTSADAVNIYNTTKYWRGIVKDNNQGTSSVFGIDW